jgi:hypothetical protein
MRHWNACWSGLAHQVCWCQRERTAPSYVRPWLVESPARHLSDMTDVPTPLWAMATGRSVHGQDSDPVARATLTWVKERDWAVGSLLLRRSRHGRTCSQAATCPPPTGEERPSASVAVHLAGRWRRKKRVPSSGAAVAPGAWRRWRGRTTER